MSETPETDALTMDGMIRCCGGVLSDQDYTIDSNGEGSVVPADFARKLERERDEARKNLAAANKGAETNAKVNQILCKKLSEAERELEWARRERDEARRERDEARKALRWIASRYCYEKTTAELAQDAYEMFSMARWTLQELEKKEEAK